MNKYLKLLLPSLLIIVMGLTVSCIQVVSPSGSTSEGIEVHGDWTITVSNPDGTVDSVHEFSNELAIGSRGGNSLLTALLANQTSIDYWYIKLGADGYGSFGDGDSCQEELITGERLIAATVGRDLMPGSPLRLTGTCTVILADTTATEGIGNVWTYVRVTDTFPSCCDNANEEVNWNGGAALPFTKHTFDNINEWPAVQNDQLVSINVVITFQ
tara:strand:- start:120 stop:761 length:642 start_codon:yes stop_codon:yes gene_type:complete